MDVARATVESSLHTTTSEPPNHTNQRVTRPQSLIFTMYGAFVRHLDGWMSVATLLALLREVGIEDAAVRSALSRFKRRGVLLAERRGGTAGYALSADVWASFDVGDARVLKRREPPTSEGWVLAAFSIPESSRSTRYRLRSRLARVGFAQVAGGLWIAPESLEADVRHIVDAVKVHDYVDVFRATHVGFGQTTAAVQSWWDLDAISAGYRQFVTAYEHVNQQYIDRQSHAPAGAFAEYTRVLTAWRPLPYSDPGLPRRYLPREWAGDAATELFYRIHDALFEPALAHVRSSAQ